MTGFEISSLGNNIGSFQLMSQLFTSLTFILFSFNSIFSGEISKSPLSDFCYMKEQNTTDLCTPYKEVGKLSDVLLVTVADDRYGRKQGKYGETQDKILKIFLNNLDFGIKKFAMWKWKHITQTDFYKENKAFLDNPNPSKNGRVYKSFVILDGLKQLQDGEFLIYNDCSPELWKNFDENYKVDKTKYNINVLKKLCISNNGILTIHVKWDNGKHVRRGEPGSHTHANFTLERCMKKMGLSEYRDSL